MFTKMDFRSPMDQLIDKTKDLIQEYNDDYYYQQLPPKLEFVLEEVSKQQNIIRKYKEFKVEWNNWIGFEDTMEYGIFDDGIITLLQYRLKELKQCSKLQFILNEMDIKGVYLLRKGYQKEDLLTKKLDNSYEEMESECNLQTEISSLDTDPVKANLEPVGKTCLKESETVCLKRKSGCKSASQTNWDKKRKNE